MTDDGAPQVHFVAVSFHSSASVRMLVDSLVLQADPAWALTIVDNSTNEGEFARLLQLSRDPRVRAVDTGSNLGYFGAAQWWLERHEPAPPWTVVCNVDVQFRADFVALLREKQCRGVPAPQIQWGSADQNPYMITRPGRAAVRRWRWQFRYLRVAQVVGALNAYSKLIPRRPTLTPSGSAIYAAHGSVMVLPRHYFDRGGSFAHPNFLFGEEVTLAERCRDLGIPITYEPDLVVNHAAHLTTGVWRSRSLLEVQRQSLFHIERLVTRDES